MGNDSGESGLNSFREVGVGGTNKNKVYHFPPKGRYCLPLLGLVSSNCEDSEIDLDPASLVGSRASLTQHQAFRNSIRMVLAAGTPQTHVTGSTTSETEIYLFLMGRSNSLPRVAPFLWLAT